MGGRRTQRLDVALTERRLVSSRTRAQALVMAGKVSVDGVVVTKAGLPVGDRARLEVAEPDHPWVGRGALKLEAALDAFGVVPAGLDCLDCGASTGGFTQLLLARGARRVVALDVGRGQLDWKLRTDPRVTVMEGANARYLEPGDLPFPIALATVDVSFISLRLVVPAVQRVLDRGAWLVCLVKPQFEAGRDQVGKGGIVRDEVVRRRVVDETVAALVAGGLELIGVIPSPIEGQKGNREELAVFRVGGRPPSHEGADSTVIAPAYVSRGGHAMGQEMLVTFPGGRRVNVEYDGFEIATDQTEEDGGDGSAPQPFDFFLASLAACAGFYALRFCQTRDLPIDGLRVVQTWERAEGSRRLARIRLRIEPPKGFPDRYLQALVRAADQCSVKKTLADPPEILTEVAT